MIRVGSRVRLRSGMWDPKIEPEWVGEVTQVSEEGKVVKVWFPQDFVGFRYGLSELEEVES